MDDNLNSSISVMFSLLQYHMFYNLITACNKKPIKEIFNKDFYNSYVLGGFTVVFYTMFIEDYLLAFIKKMKTTHKEIIVYLFLLIGFISIFYLNQCNDTKTSKASDLIKQKKTIRK